MPIEGVLSSVGTVGSETGDRLALDLAGLHHTALFHGYAVAVRDSWAG
jgi:hypothetical protein